jgi:hypothetical protein
VNWPCELKSAAKLFGEIEIQIAGGNLLRIRSTNGFRATVSRNFAYIFVVKFCVLGGDGLFNWKELSSASEAISYWETTVTEMETARKLRIEFRARNL